MFSISYYVYTHKLKWVCVYKTFAAATPTKFEVEFFKKREKKNEKKKFTTIILKSRYI